MNSDETWLSRVSADRRWWCSRWNSILTLGLALALLGGPRVSAEDHVLGANQRVPAVGAPQSRKALGRLGDRPNDSSQREEAGATRLDQSPVAAQLFAGGSGYLASGAEDGSIHTCTFSNNTWTWRRHADRNTVNDGRLSLVPIDRANFYVVGRAASGHIYLLDPNARGDKWVDLDLPDQAIANTSDPVAYRSGQEVTVLLIGQDGSLYRNRYHDGRAVGWTELESPAGKLSHGLTVSVPVPGSPESRTLPEQRILAVGNKGQLHIGTMAEENLEWQTILPPAEAGRFSGRPSEIRRNGELELMITDERNRLWYGRRDGGEWRWKELGRERHLTFPQPPVASVDQHRQLTLSGVDSAASLHLATQDPRTGDFRWTTYQSRTKHTWVAGPEPARSPGRSYFFAKDHERNVRMLGRNGTEWQAVNLGSGAPIVLEAEVWLPRHPEPSTIRYTETQGKYLIYGDVLIDPTKRGEKEQPLRTAKGTVMMKSFGKIDKEYLWPNGVVPFEIENGFSESEKQQIWDAVSHFMGKTHLTFVERNGNDKYEDYIVFEKWEERRCRSCIGRQGGSQTISLDLNICTTNTIIHEIGHAVGLWHEQSRPDRDVYVTVLESNILDGRECDFEKKSLLLIEHMLTPYDYNSVMHYGATAFGKATIDWEGLTVSGAKTTIVPNKSGITLGNMNRGLTESDVDGLNQLYGIHGVQTVAPPNPTNELKSVKMDCSKDEVVVVVAPEDLQNPSPTDLVVALDKTSSHHFYLKQSNQAKEIKLGCHDKGTPVELITVDVPPNTSHFLLQFFQVMDQIELVFTVK